MVVELYVETQRGGYKEGPAGYFSMPPDLVESDPGLYDIPTYLIESGTGLYLVPEFEAIDYFAGNRSNVIGYSVQEDSTPLDPSSMEGGAGQLTFSFNEGADTLHLIQEIITLSDTDSEKGQTQGTARIVAGDDGQTTITADSILALFNSDHIVPPMQGRLDTVLQSYATIVGIPTSLVVDPTVADRQVVYPGWNGNVWDHIKQICSAEQIEFALVYDTVLVRPVRTIDADTSKDISRSHTLSNQNTAKKVEVAYFNNKWGTRQEVYPLTTEEPSIYTVDAGETLTFEVQLNASLVSVNQPTCVSFVEDRPYPNTNGVYSVAGNDGKPITPSQWNAQGGKVSVALTDDPGLIEITVTGANMSQYAPYRLAMTAGASSYYNSLHITGTGVTWDRQTVVLTTGATSAVTGEEIGVVVENPFISSKSDAYNTGLHTANQYADTYTINGTTKTIRPRNFGEQAFGNIAGARVLRDNSVFRITNATSTPEDVQYTASQDTLFTDFNDVWSGQAVEDFNAQWSGRLIKDFNTQPLRRD